MKISSKLALLLGAAAMAIALMAPAAQAAEEPAPGYEAFAGCPSPEEEPTIEACFTSTVKAGHFQMGSKDVPITDPITFSAGGNQAGEVVLNDKGGLSKARQTIPGGLVGLTGLDWLVNALSAEALKVYAVTELAGQPTSPFEDPFVLPIKVHLENPVIGKKCYVGSNLNPINLNLTIETTNPPPPNEPISGHTAETFELDPEREGVILAKDGRFVDNAFAAPAASGCRLELGLINISIDSIVNLQSGLPSPAGTNETIQDFDAAAVESRFVYP